MTYLFPDRDKLYLLPPAVFLLAAVIYLVEFPVVAFDTDLWYHLSGGRYLFEHGAIPETSFFSFISPPRAYVNYYWLFQALVYGLYSAASYYGLILLRAVVYAATLGLVLWFLLKRTENQEQYPWIAVLFACCFLTLWLRFLLVRPHSLSYLCIIVFLYLLEFRAARAIWLLPLVGLLWANLHGVEYPVMVFILFSYGAELVVDRLRQKRAFDAQETRLLLLMAVTACTVLVNPAGWRLLVVPFTETRYAAQYIGELRPIVLGDIVPVSFLYNLASWIIPFSAILLLTGISLVASLLKGKVRMSHLLLCAGGIFLLSKGPRFVYECTLLLLPLLMEHLPAFQFPVRDRWKQVVWVLLFSALAVIPVAMLLRDAALTPRYPLPRQNLPHGACLFLNSLPSTGRVFNHPTDGGYLQWMLNPGYRIYMDMQVPFVFTDEDHFLANNCFRDAEVLGKVIGRYDPSFFIVPLRRSEFAKTITGFPHYRPVFIDDHVAVYVSAKHYPDIAARYEVKAIKPFDTVGRTVEALIEGKNRDLLAREVSTLLSIDPEGLLTNHLAAGLSMERKDYQGALRHAGVIVAGYPEGGIGYKLRGDALRKLGELEGALKSYEMAEARFGEPDRRDIYRRMATVLLELDRYAPAYQYAQKGIRPFDPETNHVELYQLGAAALLSGHRKEAEKFLWLGYQKIPEDNHEWRGHYLKLMPELAVGSRQ
jgi:hypothetical protein